LEIVAAMSSPNEAAPTGRRILIVESEVGVADELARILNELGHIVKISSDAKSALHELDDFVPQLVLLGTYLADMPGYELSSILKGAAQYSYKFRHATVLYVADRNKILKTRFSSARDVPISHYIFKPLNPAEVREKVMRGLLESPMSESPSQ
jgi:PleD family two-component response regulator